MADGPVYKHYSIKSYPFMIDARPYVLLKLIRLDSEDEDDEFAGHSFLLNLDQVDVLLSDLDLSKAQAINEYIRERAMLRELDQELDEWGHEKDPPAEDSPPAE